MEVSRYTGRIHLYICLPGMDLRPRPLFVNFRQEELDSIVLLICLQEESVLLEESVSQLVKENPRYFNIFQTFIKEWNSLRPIERCKLLGKPLQLPLSIELCYLKEATNHGSSGLLKGGSKRRVTPLSEISHTLPENAVWKKVVLHGCSLKGKEYAQAFSVSGIPLCKLCHVPCNGKLSTVPEFFEDLFCNIGCFQEFRIRTSQKALRKELFGIEHGVCVMCSLDCHKLVKSLMPLSIANRRSYIERIAPGECRLENMRTLCVACHAEVTKAQGVERLLARKRAREQLKMTMKVLQHFDDGEKKRRFLYSKQWNLGGGEASEDMLLVHVPGSAYSESSSGYMGCHSSKSASSSAKQTARWKSTGIVALRDSKLKVLPDDVLEVDTFVRTLDMSNNKVAEIPLDIGKLINMQRLVLTNNMIHSLPSTIGSLRSLKILTLDENRMAILPDEHIFITPMVCSSISLFVCETMNTKKLKDAMDKAHALSLLNVSRNKLRTLPPSIGGCTSLEELQANDNSIEELPETLCNLVHLKSLLLNSNKVNKLPQNLLKCCQALQNLSLHGNVITMDQLQQMEGFEEFEQRRRKKFDKQINSNVLMNSKGLDEGLDL
ncbi:hypothetical protein HPP92_012969 [Vanilla planifolia]|uniref:Uncharacterized protein n=1 Tax=Vanilla planifolia TaxID=51239 RepID=A0A835QRG6_VANPL|nr:hypothetical protein HPP92_012969 [Vanilla planifolia]